MVLSQSDLYPWCYPISTLDVIQYILLDVIQSLPLTSSISPLSHPISTLDIIQSLPLMSSNLYSWHHPISILDVMPSWCHLISITLMSYHLYFWHHPISPLTSSNFYPWRHPISTLNIIQSHPWCHPNSILDTCHLDVISVLQPWCHFISTFNITSSLPLILPNLYTWCPQQNTAGLPTPVFHTVSNKYGRLKIKPHVDCTHTTGNVTRVKGNRSTPMMAKERPISCRENPSPPAGRCHSWWYRISIIMVTIQLKYQPSFPILVWYQRTFFLGHAGANW